MNSKNLYPKAFFEYFDDICKIPRGSGNEHGMVKYLSDFAASKGLEFYTDEHRNVLIKKPATAGYENLPVIALQGHADMVCQKTAESTHDFTSDPIEWFVDGEYIRAKDTSLGADDGAAVCIMLSILASTDIPHPALHCLFTAEEETGLFGAGGFDYSKIADAVYMINIDGEEEYEVLCSCAGGLRLNLQKKHVFEKEVPCISICIDGLCGGHSGADIHKNRINANTSLASLLKRISSTHSIQLSEFSGGTVDNAIAPHAQCVLGGISLSDAMLISKEFESELKLTACDEDKNLCINVSECDSRKVLSSIDTLSFIDTVCEIKCGVIKMSDDVEGLVQTSANVGVVDFKDGNCDIHVSIRSSSDREKNELCEYNSAIGAKYGFSFVAGQSYPGWDFKKDSVLRTLYSDAFAKTHGGKKPIISAIHAGLECGIISGNLPDLDIIAIGPEMSGVHSPAEKLDIASVGRIYDTVIELFKSLKD